MRAGEIDATGYYLAKMLRAGKIKIHRPPNDNFRERRYWLGRKRRTQSGNSAFDATTKLGMPEAGYVLFHVAVALTKIQKIARNHWNNVSILRSG